MTTVTFKIRRDTASAWTSANPVLSLGEPGLETDTKKVKYGDGVTAWTSLGYAVGATVAVTWGGITGTLGSQADLSAALSAKEPTIAAGTTSQYWRGDKTWRTAGTSIGVNTGTSGATIPLLNGANTWSALQTYSAGFNATFGNFSSDVNYASNMRINGGTSQSKLDIYGQNDLTKFWTFYNFSGSMYLRSNVGATTFNIDGDKLVVRTPTTAQASFNLPPGTAPTSPSNGDVWGTTAGVFFRVNGSTASLVGTHSGTSSGTNTGDQTTITGNAGSATILQTARTINGVSFNGSANIAVPPYNAYVNAAVNRTLSVADVGASILLTGATTTITLAADAAMPVGTRVTLINFVGSVTIAKGAGTTNLYWYNAGLLDANRTLAFGGWADLVKVNTDGWVILGQSGVS